MLQRTNYLAAGTPGEEGKWFTSAKDAQLFDLALKLARKVRATGGTLGRANRRLCAHVCCVHIIRIGCNSGDRNDRQQGQGAPSPSPWLSNRSREENAQPGSSAPRPRTP